MNMRATRPRILSQVVIGLSGFLFANAFLVCGQVPGIPSNQPTSVAPSDSDTLTKIEDRLFEHDYSSDDDASRLSRLEKFVYGNAQTGSLQSRLTKLQASLANEKPSYLKDEDTVALNSAPTSSESDQQESNSSDRKDTDAYAPTFDYSHYPRVTELEKQLLGNSYADEPLQKRLVRLETKAFGQPSTSTDFSQRVDKLDDYAQRHDIYKEHSVTAPMIAAQPQSTDSDTPPPPVNPFVSGMVTSIDQRTSTMEQVTFGHTYESHPLAERVQRLEKRLVPYQHNLASKDLPGRVDHLWSILSIANTLNHAPVIASNITPAAGPSVDAHTSTQTTTSEDSSTQQTKPSTSHHSWLHKLGQTLESGAGNGYGMPPYGGPGGLNSDGIWIP